MRAVSASPVVDGLLASELGSGREDVTLSSADGVKALLQFSHSLTRNEITMAEARGVRFLRRGSHVVHVGSIYLAEVFTVQSLMSLTDMGLVRATSGSKRFYPALTSSVPAIRADTVQHNLHKDGSPIDGTGALVAVLDTGVSWLHPSFWQPTTGALPVLSANGSYYVDINTNGVADSDEGPIAVVHQQDPSAIEVSNEYLYIDIDDNGKFDFANGDRWLAGVDEDHDGLLSLPSEKVVLLGQPKVRILYDQYTGNVYVRGVNLTADALGIGDTNGHGTHVASIIAGGQPGYTAMVGVAPGADLLVIRSPLMSSDVLDGIFFAAEHDADIINMSFSSFLGFLDGTDTEDLAVSEAMRTSGLVSSLASGNLAGYNKHARFSVMSGQTGSVKFAVNSPPKYSFLNVLWYSHDDDEHVFLRSPNGNSIDLGVFSDVAGHSYIIEDDDLKAYYFADVSVRGTNRIIVQVSEDDHEWASGTWTLEMENPSGETVEVNCYAWGSTWSDAYLRFTTHVDNSRTVSSPGTADLGIAVGSCNDYLSTLSASSGRGPRIDGVQKPEVVAPGLGITAARNSLSSLWISRSGTSMASPHVAGVLALVCQALGEKTGWALYSAVVQGAGGNTHHNDPPEFDWGFGAVDALEAVRTVYSPEPLAGSSIAEWSGIDTAWGPDVEDALPGGQDLVTVKTFASTERLAVAVTTREMPDFGSGVLTVGWDTDNNKATGKDGVDVLVNVTGEVATAYRWNGMSFAQSGDKVTLWNHSTSLFVWLDLSPALPLSVRVESSVGSAPVDETGWLTISDRWSPYLANLNIEHSGNEWKVSLGVSDIDTRLSDLQYHWSVVDGSMTSLLSGSGPCSSEPSIQVDTGALGTPDAPALLLNVTGSSPSLRAPILVLSRATAARVKILSAVLNTTIVAVGPLVESMVKGTIVVEGSASVDTVQVAFHSPLGFWLNFTLQGEDGVYPFTVAASGFAPGEHQVYAVVTDTAGVTIEKYIGILTVTTDYSRVGIIVAAVVGVTVIFALVRRHRALS
ncbi:MAG: S8 family serine peptidase [Candidatus Thorarchaeota archaeon]